MTPSQFVGQTQDAVTEFMAAVNKLKNLSELQQSIGTEYASDHFTIDDPDNPGTLIDNPGLAFTKAEFDNIYYAVREATSPVAIITAVDAHALTFNKIRTK